MRMTEVIKNNASTAVISFIGALVIALLGVLINQMIGINSKLDDLNVKTALNSSAVLQIERNEKRIESLKDWVDQRYVRK